MWIFISNSNNGFSYCLNSPCKYSDPEGKSEIAINPEFNQLLYTVAETIPPIAFLLLGLQIVTVYIGMQESKSHIDKHMLEPPEESGDIDWSHSNHFLHGSSNHGGHNWNKFTPPDGPARIGEFLLPLLKRVIDEGTIKDFVSHGRDGIFYVFEYYFPEHGTGIAVSIIQLFSDGTYHFSNAWQIP